MSHFINLTLILIQLLQLITQTQTLIFTRLTHILHQWSVDCHCRHITIIIILAQYPIVITIVF